MDYAKVLNGEVVEVLRDYKPQEGDLTAPHPVKQCAYILPIEVVPNDVYDADTHTKNPVTYTVSKDKVLAEASVREKTEEDVALIRKGLLIKLRNEGIDFLLSQSSEYTTKQNELLALTNPRDILAYDVSFK